MKLSNNIYYNLMALLFSVLVGVFIFLGEVLQLGGEIFIEWEVLEFQGASVLMVLFLDLMSISFIVVVGLISGFILGYSKYYMAGSKDFYRFLVILLLFVLSMWLLILSPNTISLLLGWDGLGLTSYLLVIYYQNNKSNNAGMLTVLSNRVGDVCILMAIGLIIYMGSWSFLFFGSKGFLVLCSILVLAGMTKSAQIPFSAWLPAAMAAPTPVSSLVHSSTLVTAGVYLILRFYDYLCFSAGLAGFLFVVSVMTMFMAGFCANFEMDMKKIVALSTLSQLGLMMMEISLGYPLLAYCHLVCHAIFKSTIFMCAGVVIHSNKGSQDMRSLGSQFSASPLLSVLFSVTNLSLCGFPFLAGYFSKDMLLESSFSFSWSGFISLMVVLGTGFTVSYSLRVLYMSSSSFMKSSSSSALADLSKPLSIMMSFMFVLSVVIGLFVMGFFMDFGNIWLMSYFQKYYILFVSTSALIICWFTLGLSWYWLNMSRTSLKGLSSMWFCLLVVSKMNMYMYLFLGNFIYVFLDKGWGELLGGQGGRQALIWGSSQIQMGQSSLFISMYLLSGLGFLLLFCSL